MTLASVMVAAVLAAGPVSLKYEGPLKDALTQIAEKGGLNLVVVGKLDEPAQVNLKDVTAEEALATVAKVYELDVTREGKMWVIREKAAVKAADKSAGPVPPMPPLPPVGGEEDAEAKAAAREAALEAKEAAREAALEAKERALEAKEATREAALEVKEQVKESMEQAREQIEEARAQAEEARARAEEARARAKDVVSTGPVVVKANEVADTAVSYGGPVVVEQNAVVEGDAVSFGGDVELKENAVVKGDAVSFGGRVIKHANAQVRGEEVSMGGGGLGSVIAQKAAQRHKHEGHSIRLDGDDGDGFSLARFLVMFSLLFGFGFMLRMVAPQRMERIEEQIRAAPVTNWLVGVLGLIASIPLMVVSIVTVIGPVVVALLLLVSAPVAVVGTAMVLGEKLPTGRMRKTQALALAAGLLLVLLAWQIPVLGWMLMSFVVSMGLGAIIRTRFGTPPRGLPVVDSAAQIPAV